jgi:ABC-type uncharacterized transport system permease subunit
VSDRIPLRFERRLERTPAWVNVATPVGAFLFAFVIVAIVLLIGGHNPLDSFNQMLQASVTNANAISQTLVSATPLLFTGLCAAVAFRMGIWNIGGEGQLYIGAVCASGVAIAIGSHGIGIALPAMVIAAAIGGALWAAIPGVLRAYLNANEILTSLMLNYIAALLLDYLIEDSSSYWRDLSSATALVFPQGKQIPTAAYWPTIGHGSLVIPFGFLLGVALAGVLFTMIRHTWFGYQLRVTADNPGAGRYAGMASKRNLVFVMLISGAAAAIAGASQVGDFSHVLDPSGLQSPQYGYTGIVVAALARYNPVAVIASALLLGGITNAGLNVQSASFPQSLTGVIEGIILFCVLGSEVLTRYRVRWVTKAPVAQEPLAEEPVAA